MQPSQDTRRPKDMMQTALSTRHVHTVEAVARVACSSIVGRPANVNSSCCRSMQPHLGRGLTEPPMPVAVASLRAFGNWVFVIAVASAWAMEHCLFQASVLISQPHFAPD